MTDPTLTVTARRVTMAIRAPAVQRLFVGTPAPVRLTVRPWTRIGIAVPNQGPPGPQGVPGPPGPPGPSGGPPTLYPIANAASFTAMHGLPYPPRSLLLDLSGAEVDTDTLYAPGQVTFVFPQPFTGTLYLG